MKLKTIPYSKYETGLPQTDHWILGQASDDTITVYQAFNHAIANYAVANQKFGGNSYNFSRMSWIKPNFLWMMYRSGWASKENQERILALRISKEGFWALLEEGVYSSYIEQAYSSRDAWKEALQNSNVRIQWDPDHNPHGDKLERRAIQIGMKGTSLKKFNDEYLKEVIDITDFVKEQHSNMKNNQESFFVIDESILEIPEGLRKKYFIPESFISIEIQHLLDHFNTRKQLDFKDFELLLLQKRKLRKEFIQYIKNYTDKAFSRYLLKQAIAYRKEGKEILCEDLLTFSFFASKNKEAADLKLIMHAKLTDFDTWVGFDGELVFYALGYEDTLRYLQENKEVFGEKAVSYYSSSFSLDYLYNDINKRAYWYL